MRHSGLDWSFIKFAMLTFIVVVLISVSLVIASWLFKDNMLAEYHQQKQKFLAITQQYLVLAEDEKSINQYYPQFVDLYRQGIIGPEHRLNWIETLRLSSDRIKLFALNYHIYPQQRYVTDFSIELGHFLLYDSTMKLNISMLHEGDLLRLIDDLNKHAIGLFTITECKFMRPSSMLVQQRDGVNVKADCWLRWLNIRRADGTEIKLS